MHMHDFRYPGLRKGFIFTALFLVTRLAKLSTGLILGLLDLRCFYFCVWEYIRGHVY